MNVWFSIKGALTGIDLVTQGWGRDVGIDECGVMILGILGKRGAMAERELSILTGRSRQQIHNALTVMKQREIVVPALVSETGRTKAYGLTVYGEKLWRILERGLTAWEEMASTVIDLAELNRMLKRVVDVCVNQVHVNGWKKGLHVPYALRKVPLSFEAGLLADYDAGKKAEERQQRERAESEWQAMLDRISR